MDSQTLILIPTELERGYLIDNLPSDVASGNIELCGFGPLASACRTMQLLCTQSFQRVILCGIAGTMSPSTKVGKAYWFSQVSMDGIGIEQSGSVLSGHRAGFDRSVPDILELASAAGPCGGLLLTSCIASADPTTNTNRQKSFPAATAEEMEGFGVATACYLRKVPLTILRGISNQCGDRDKANWKIGEALQAVTHMLLSNLPDDRIR